LEDDEGEERMDRLSRKWGSRGGEGWRRQMKNVG